MYLPRGCGKYQYAKFITTFCSYSPMQCMTSLPGGVSGVIFKRVQIVGHLMFQNTITKFTHSLSPVHFSFLPVHRKICFSSPVIFLPQCLLLVLTTVSLHITQKFMIQALTLIASEPIFSIITLDLKIYLVSIKNCTLKVTFIQTLEATKI